MGEPKPHEYAFFSLPIKVSWLIVIGGFFLLLCLVLGAYKLGDINRLAQHAYTQAELQKLKLEETQERYNERLANIEAELRRR